MTSCASVSMKSRLRRQLQARPVRFGLGLLVMSALALPLAGPASATSSGVSSTPAKGTPTLATSGKDGSVEQVRQIVQCLTAAPHIWVDRSPPSTGQLPRTSPPWTPASETSSQPLLIAPGDGSTRCS
jgi:hypothetical protein